MPSRTEKGLSLTGGGGVVTWRGSEVRARPHAGERWGGTWEGTSSLWPPSPCPSHPEHAEADTFFCFTNLMAEIRDNFIKSLDDSQCGITYKMEKVYSTLKDKDVELYLKLVREDPPGPHGPGQTDRKGQRTTDVRASQAQGALWLASRD